MEGFVGGGWLRGMGERGREGGRAWGYECRVDLGYWEFAIV